MGLADNHFFSHGRPSILIADDDEDVCDLLARYLTIEKYDVVTCNKGNDVWHLLETAKPHLVILDLYLPDIDGFVLGRQLYEKYNIPFIMLTARDTISDRVQGLSIGADDYITKPFDLDELSARIQAVLRRSRADRGWPPQKIIEPILSKAVIASDDNKPYERTAAQGIDSCFEKSDTIICFEEWQLIVGCRSLVSPQGSVIKLPQADYEFLVSILRNANKILTRDDIMLDFRGRPLEPYERTVDVFIGKLRRIIETDHKAPALCRTVYGQGYIFTADVKVLSNS